MWNIKKRPPLTSLKKKEKGVLNYLHVVIKIIRAEFEIIVTVQMSFSKV